MLSPSLYRKLLSCRPRTISPEPRRSQAPSRSDRGLQAQDRQTRKCLRAPVRSPAAASGKLSTPKPSSPKVPDTPKPASPKVPDTPKPSSKKPAATPEPSNRKPPATPKSSSRKPSPKPATRKPSPKPSTRKSTPKPDGSKPPRGPEQPSPKPGKSPRKSLLASFEQVSEPSDPDPCVLLLATAPETESEYGDDQTLKHALSSMIDVSSGEEGWKPEEAQHAL